VITLAMDTSGPVGSVAVVREDADGRREVLDHAEIERGMKHGVELFPALERCLRKASVPPRDVDVVAVGTGPGSYTGLRVGITAARAFAYAAGAAILGVPSCDAWAEAARPGGRPLAVVLDARVRAAYLAVYEPADAAGEARWRRVAGPELVEPAALASRIPGDAEVAGDAFDAFPDELAPYARAAAPSHVPAAEVALLALDRRARGEKDAIDAVVPLYLRRGEPRRPEAPRG
jgi:tRNA threonylcarbamoyl adenosine modification protein YeaZ